MAVSVFRVPSSTWEGGGGEAIWARGPSRPVWSRAAGEELQGREVSQPSGPGQLSAHAPPPQRPRPGAPGRGAGACLAQGPERPCGDTGWTASAAFCARRLLDCSGFGHRAPSGLTCSAPRPEQTLFQENAARQGSAAQRAVPSPGPGVGVLPHPQRARAFLLWGWAERAPSGPLGPRGVVTQLQGGDSRGQWEAAGRGWGFGGPRPGDESVSGVSQLPRKEAAKRSAQSPAPPTWLPRSPWGQPQVGQGKEATGRHFPAELGPGQQRFPVASSRQPAALPHQEAIPERSCKAPGSGSGEISKGPPGNLGCQTRAGVTPPGVCLPGDRCEGGWLSSAFRGDRARLGQAGSGALPVARWLPGGQRIYFKSQKRTAGREGEVRFELTAESQP